MSDTIEQQVNSMQEGDWAMPLYPSELSVLAEPSESESATPIFLSYNSRDEYISKLESALKDASRVAGYQLMVLDAQNYVNLQLAQVAGASKRNEPAILINLVDPSTASRVLEVAGNMKVVFLNRAPSDLSVLNENAIYVGPDERMAGQLQGEWLADYFTKKNKNEIKYILLKGPENLASTIQRTEAVLQTLSDRGIHAVEATPPIVANYDRQEAFEKLLPVLSPGLSFDAIISNNDAMALGAIEALEFLDIDPKSTVIVGIDAIQPAIQALRDGNLSMTAFQDAEVQSKTAITALSNMLAGKPFYEGIDYPVSKENPYMITIPFELVTPHHIPQNLYFNDNHRIPGVPSGKTQAVIPRKYV